MPGDNRRLLAHKIGPDKPEKGRLVMKFRKILGRGFVVPLHIETHIRPRQHYSHTIRQD